MHSFDPPVGKARRLTPASRVKESAQSMRRGLGMAWKIEGQYIENCSCEVPCPCTVSLDLGADYDRCNAFLVFQVESGEIEGVDVSGLTVAAVGDSPKVMSEGNWRLGILIDEKASDEQAEKLEAVFGGQLGGPMEALAPLVGEMLGSERIALNVSHENGTHRVKVGDSGEVAVQEIVPFGKENGEPAKLVDIFHPAADRFNIAKATTSSFSAFGMDFAHEGKSGFAARFSWAA
jgi:hypothetical protein